MSQTASSPRSALSLSLAALGIVFGDLGTSPLYALQEAFHPGRGVSASPENVIGCLSLFLWSLIIMVSLKYVYILMRADNQGEGGILALTALLLGAPSRRRARQLPGGLLWIMLALVGTAMLYGDGVITPAISVLSAVEGLSVATPGFEGWVVPLTVVILLMLFAMQSVGSGKVGAAFGPILATWFVAIALLGLSSLLRTPQVLAAFNPMEGMEFFQRNGFRGFMVLGAVVLCLTGGEALYADMGHFGRRPIRLAWYVLALPALILSYLGQGALLLRDPSLADHPFYAMVPGWALYPMVALATLATIVASQALISAVFSLTSQAMQLGLSPRLRVVHTSAAARGQIYIPVLNWMLMAATIAVVLGFRSSSALAAAFGLAVSTTMAITTLLFTALARWRWHWSPLRVAAVAGVFLVADLAFIGANALKFTDGGWLPLALGTLAFLLMASWRYGRLQLVVAREASCLTLVDFVDSLRLAPPHRVTGTAVFLCENSWEVPRVLLHHLKHNQTLHEKVILLTLETTDAPRVPEPERLGWEVFDLGITRLVARHGFMETPGVPDLLQQAAELNPAAFRHDTMTTSYYLGRESLQLHPDWHQLRRVLLAVFVWLRRNQQDATSYFGIPANRVVEIGSRVEFRSGA